MNVIALGLSHKTAPVELREKAVLSDSAARAMIADLTASEYVTEAAALSTCNRSEIYLASPDPPSAEAIATEALVRHTNIPADSLACARYVLRDDQAAAHLYRVAASLDSMVLGESEIQAQVREAWERAMALDAAGPQLNRLFRGALEVGKQVRTATMIGRGAVSVSSVAVDLALQTIAELASSTVLVLGAGAMAEATTRALVEQGAANVVVANRTEGTAHALARRVGGRGVSLAAVGPELAKADILIASTDAPHPVLMREDLEHYLHERSDRPMLLIDISVPRDLDPAIGELPGITLHDIDDLQRVVEDNVNGRRAEAERGELIVTDAVAHYAGWRANLTAAPTIRSLRERAERIRQAELDRVRGRVDALSDDDRKLIEAVSRGILNTLLHDPTVKVQEAARSGDGTAYLESLRHLFDLDSEG
ncbi:MAG: glutamyl-tRNA reductase [Thermoleophilia bacterium]|nr:glutamyl-tRNA reductase [Thermoleophilia bacterium]MDH3725506.1 glutamyl-tRNA reductase [Thermoleophilia bacterium]